MAEALPTEHGKSRRNTVEDTLDVDVDHLVPIIDAQLVQQRYWPYPGVADKHVDFAEPLTGQRNEPGQFIALLHVRSDIGRFATRYHNLPGNGLKAIRPARAEYELRPPPCEQERRRPANPAAGTGNRNDFACGS